ncbi:MAG: hypothetical protein K2Q18_05700, partial [Bdellovibrionales bacterium]|nr:hypothetical protein [Bdellovibrionales bacterium]
MKNLIVVLILSLLTACNIEKGTIAVRFKGELKNPGNFSLASVQIINHQFVLNGANLSNVKDVKIKEGTTETVLAIESVNSTTIVTNTMSNITIAAGKVFSFILSDAGAANTFTVNFSLCDSTLNGKGFNCLVTPNDK